MKKIYLNLLVPFIAYSHNLSQIVDLSTQNDFIKSNQYQVESLKNSYSSVQNKYMPKLTFGATYSNTNEETASVPDSSTVAYANLHYSLYDGGKKQATFKSLETNIKSSEKNLKILKNQISLQVVQSYYTYLSLLSSKTAKQKEIQTLEAQQARLEKFLDAGTVTSDEVYKIVSRVQNTQVSLHEIELNLQTILHNLEYLTSQKVSIEDGSIIEFEQSSQNNTRDDIEALKLKMEASLQNARASKSDNYPSISLDNTFSYYDLDYDNQAYDPNVETQNTFKINLTWNIFDFGATKDAYNSSYKQYLGNKALYEYEKNKANIDLQLAIKSYKIGELKIKSAQSSLKAATATFDTITKKYQNGLVDNVTYLEAVSEKFNAQSVEQSAKYDLEIKKANIIYHSGKNIKEFIK